MISPILDIVTDEEAINQLTNIEQDKGEETGFWLRKQKKAMKMMSRSYVDYGNYWRSNFHAFEFINVEFNEQKMDHSTASKMMRRHTMSSI
jgi:hypothetical protein